MSVRKKLPAALVAGALAATAFAAPAMAGERTGDRTPDGTGDRHRATRAAVEALVRDGVPGALAQAQDRHGTWNGSAGVADRTTGAPRHPRDRYRVGSITKPFVATVVLQLEAEGRLDLDDTVERRLPGVVRGNGHDGRKITLRQLLNHTSGVYDVTSDPGFQDKVLGSGFLEHRYDTWAPRHLVDIAMRHAPDFAPGTGWSYSNTNYVLAGLVIEKVTGRPYGKEVERRVLKPLGLRATSVPGIDPRMPAPSGRAYSTLGREPGAPVHDVTELNPSVAWAAGEMVSDSADLQRFVRALLTGRLLPPRQMKELTATVPVGADAPGVRYGLGVMVRKLSCGEEAWGHGGGIHGSGSDVVATRDGKHSLALNVNGDWAGDTHAVVEAEFCG
ncbi:serine hydrolase domain-containing protein [Streptomyces ficellus]|uniref:Class A beta-lactamase-related serine hydrolase n=1 Tax=Streptomyces ficellus TaxID=1977088 RepID=A0A6I6FC26_9ACTN|nr:serine hydrolase domain-containing protein [Streptomyces ficellus]QGV80614.1 class A beta-lactamase-related serine hydrolase [Streptomyces ficellus]